MNSVRPYNNGLVQLPIPVPNQDVSMVVHPLMTYSLSNYPAEYIENLLHAIESDWRGGRQPVFLLQTSDAQRFWVINPSVTKSSRRFARHNKKATATLDETRDYLSRHLPRPLIEQSGYLVSANADPTRIKMSQLTALPLDDILLHVNPTSVRVHGELFSPNQEPSRNCYGCVNNVIGICRELGIPYEKGVVFTSQYGRYGRR